MTTLVIIDMQTDFAGTAEEVIPNVCREVRLAKRRKAAIIIVEYERSGETFPEITKLLTNYERKITVMKDGDGGGFEVMMGAEEAGFDRDRMRFCGVNRGACVRETIEGAHRHGLFKEHTEIAIEATNCNFPEDGLSDLKDLGQFV